MADISWPHEELPDSQKKSSAPQLVNRYRINAFLFKYKQQFVFKSHYKQPSPLPLSDFDAGGIPYTPTNICCSMDGKARQQVPEYDQLLPIIIQQVPNLWQAYWEASMKTALLVTDVEKTDAHTMEWCLKAWVCIVQ